MAGKAQLPVRLVAVTVHHETKLFDVGRRQLDGVFLEANRLDRTVHHHATRVPGLAHDDTGRFAAADAYAFNTGLRHHFGFFHGTLGDVFHPHLGLDPTVGELAFSSVVALHRLGAAPALIGNLLGLEPQRVAEVVGGDLRLRARHGDAITVVLLRGLAQWLVIGVANKVQTQALAFADFSQQYLEA